MIPDEFLDLGRAIASGIYFFLAMVLFAVGSVLLLPASIPMGLTVTFNQAIKIANKLNPEKLWTFPWAKELE